MIYRYIVSRELDGTRQVGGCLTGFVMSDHDAIIGAGFDPLDPFANFNVSYDIIPAAQYFEYGGTLSGIIMDHEDVQTIYEERFKRPYKIQEEAV